MRRSSRVPLVAIALLAGLLFGCNSRAEDDSVSLPRFDGFAAVQPGVAYRGPQRLSGQVRLRAEVDRAPARERVVAVTFLLDGRPLGSDTTAPYSLDVDAGRLPAGDHRLRVVAVNRLGGRRATRPVSVITGGAPERALTASPGRGLRRALSALARGGTTVRLAPGRYRLRHVSLGDGARLLGSGPRTVILPPAGEGYDALLVVAGKGVRVSDLSLDGGGPGPGPGRAVQVAGGSADVRLQRLRIRNVRQDGLHLTGVHAGVSLQDSVIEGRGTAAAGVYLNPVEGGGWRDTSVIRTRISGVRDHGIHFSHLEHGDWRAGLRALALDNRVSRVKDPRRNVCVRRALADGCGTNEGGIWSGGAQAAIIGNAVSRTRWDGIQTVGSSNGVAIVGNRVSRTGTGIYLEHSTNRSLVARNRVSGVGTGIKVEWTYGGVGSVANSFVSNRISNVSDAGLFVDVQSDRNRILGNLVAQGGSESIVLQGSSFNLVKGNRGCRVAGEMVRQQEGRYDDGRLAEPRGNRLIDNRKAGSC